MEYTASDAMKGIKMIVLGMWTVIGWILFGIAGMIVHGYDRVKEDPKGVLVMAAGVVAIMAFVPAFIVLAWLIA